MSSAGSKDVSFRLHALGHPWLEVIEQGTVTNIVGPGKPLALVTYLSLTAHRTESRDILCELLWGDRTTELARRQVRQAIWLVKTEIHPELISATNSSVSISGELTIDVDDFLAAIEANNLSAALDLYKGDFFTDYASPGAATFEEWANLERTRLRGRFVHTAEIAAKGALDSGRFSDAIGIAARMRSIEPHSQAAWRLLLEARISSGDAIGAMADAEQFEEWLKSEEWEPEPSSATLIRAARHSVKNGSSSRASTGLITELVGREKEFAALSAAWEALEAGHAQVVQVKGDSGMGKTRLVSDFVARIRASRGRARYIRANYGEREIAHSFASAIAADLASLSGAKGISQGSAQTLTALNPSLTSVFSAASGTGPSLTSLKVGLALVDLIGAVSDEKPIAVVFDDMHWADVESRDVLTVLAARLKTEDALIIGTSRPNYITSLVSEQCRTLRLSPLSQGDVRTLLGGIAELPNEQWATDFIRHLYESTGGIPLGVIEAIRACADSGLLIRDKDVWHCTDPARLSYALRETTTLERRLSVLPSSHAAVLRAIAVAGIPLPRAIVARTAGIADVELAQVTSDLELAGLIKGDRETIDLCHDSIAEELTGTSDRELIDRTNLRLGASMAAEDDHQWRARSIQHLASAGAWATAARQLTRVLQKSRSRKEIDNGIRLLLGSSNSDESLQNIRKELPFDLRFPGWRRTALVGVIPVVLLGTAFLVKAAKETERIEPTSLMIIRGLSGDKKEFREVSLDFERWDPFAPEKARTLTRTWRNVSRLDSPTPRPGCSCWAIRNYYADAGEGDIDIVSVDGSRTRLTASPGDDIPVSFSPDGNQLLFLTTRWSKSGWWDIGVLNMSTRRITQLTHDQRKHGNASWSPDGTRILFDRGGNRELLTDICVMDADGANTRCFNRPDWSRLGAVGWVNDRQALVAYKAVDSTVTPISLVDVDNWKTASTDFPINADVRLDPTGRWAIVNPASSPAYARIAPVGRFAAARALDSAYENQPVFFVPRLASTYLDSLSIEFPEQPLAVGAPHLLLAIGWSHDRHRLAPASVRWRSLTPKIADIDTMGVLTAKKEGDAVIELSAGGWRTTVDTVRVRSMETTTLIDEHWTADSFKSWVLFGDPKPVIEQSDTLRVFNNSGDGNFFSGAYYSRSFDVGKGIAMDFTVSTRITRTQWQVIIAGLAGVGEANQLSTWDRKTGYFPNGTGFGCWFAYPQGEGANATTAPVWYGGMKKVFPDKSFRIDDGRWYRVRLQLFPDGRCGVAINGQPLEITASAFQRVKSATSVIQGSNVGSHIIVGPLQIHSGVPLDVNWNALRSADGSRWLRPGVH